MEGEGVGGGTGGWPGGGDNKGVMSGTALGGGEQQAAVREATAAARMGMRGGCS